MSKILIVDDALDVREFSKSFFKKCGIDVLTAADGEAALRVIEQEMPGLVLLDIRMEGMSGIDVLRELRRRDISIKVMLVSATKDEMVIKEAECLGCLGCIQKPLVLEELKRLVFLYISE